MSAALTVIAVLVAVAGLVVLGLAQSRLSAASQHGVPAPLRFRRQRAVGLGLLLLGVVLIALSRLG